MRKRIKKILKKIIKALLVLLAFVLLIAIIVFYFHPSWFVDFYIGQDEHSIWAMGTFIPFQKELSDTNTYKYNLEWSPDEKYLVYADFFREVINDKEYFIKVIDVRELKIRTVFIGTDRTIYYKWLDNDNIRVYVSVGTGARIYRDINIHLKEPFVAIENLDIEYWTPQAWYNYDD